MKNVILIILFIFSLGVSAHAENLLETYADKLTSIWTAPFSWEDIRTKDAPIGPYLGNGEVGVVAHTTLQSQTLRISKVNFVTDGWNDWAGSGPAALPAAELRFCVESPQNDSFRFEMDQRRACLRFQSATESRVRMTTRLLMDEDIIVTELTNPSDAPVNISVETCPLSEKIYKSSLESAGEMALLTRTSQTENNVRWVSKVGVATRVIGAEATCETSDAPRLIRQRFTLPSRGTVFVVTAVTGGGKGADAHLEEGKEAHARLNVKNVKNKIQRHTDWWNEMWNRSWADTGDTLLNHQYLSSLYLLSSAYSPRTSACGGMYGVWNMDDEMMYHGDIHLNYNSQGGFYSLFSSNRPELALPFYDFLERMIPEGRRRAREELGLVHPSLKGKQCRGILFPVSALGTGEFYGEYWQQTMDAPFNVPLFGWFFDYTGDTDFLRQRAYPFIRECGDFYEDYLQKENTDSGYVYSIVTGAHEGSWDKNPPSELALVECTFRLLLRYSRLLGIDAERRELWEDIVNHLPSYKIILPTKSPNEGKPVFAKNEEGWDRPSHVIQLHCAYPCETLHLHSDPELLQIARNTLHYYGFSQRGFTETMNELGLSAFVMGARVNYAPQILKESLRTLCQRREHNFLIRDGHHCLEKTALVETLNSMMLQSVEDVLHLFPCWDATPASFHKLRTKGAFLVSAAFDGKEVTELSLTSERGNLCTVKSPWEGRNVLVRCGKKNVTARLQNNLIQFETKRGQTYQVLPQ
ncbi:MAG: glycosyl hydrolase family 95 catalytic domain-containing protein [Alloprevotella sp.]